MKRELAVLVLDCMTRVRSSLETDDDIGVLCQYVCDLSLSFIAPVGAYDSFYHTFPPILRCTATVP